MAKWKEVNAKPGKINGLILKTKADQKEKQKDLTMYNSHPWIMFSLNWLVIIWRGGGGRGGGLGGGSSFEFGRPRPRGRKNFGRRSTGGVRGSLKLDNFHGRHVCIIPNSILYNLIRANIPMRGFLINNKNLIYKKDKIYYLPPNLVINWKRFQHVNDDGVHPSRLLIETLEQGVKYVQS